MALTPLLGIGSSALGATQTAINVTGNNVANVNTVGYSRQTAHFQELRPVDFVAGQLGQGVRVSEVYRNFNRFIEDSFLDRSSTYNRWQEQQSVLQSVQSLFNESNTSGISYALGEFFGSWQDLSLRPDDVATRKELLSNAETVANLLRSAKQGLNNVQREMDMYINQTVGDVNNIIESIQKLNIQIGATDIPGVSNANGLKDQRDQLVRQLAEMVDVDVIDKGGSSFDVRLKSGLPLLEGNNVYRLQVSASRVENDLRTNSGYEGTMIVEGSDSHEYSFEVVTPPKAELDDDGNPVPGKMRVSLDGGRTWLRNEDGSEMLVDIPADANHTVKVKDINVAFNADPSKLVAGDKFDVVPKSGLYWDSPTRPPLNITPQTLNTGEDNPGRLVGGKLAAYFNVRDQNAGRYADKLDALANSLAWEVNRLHSQGGGSKHLTYEIGSYQVRDPELPLGDSASGLPFFNRLSEGNFCIQMYDKDGKPITEIPDGPGGTQLMPRAVDFDPDAEGVQNFDPTKHSMADVARAINSTYGAEGTGHVRADIVDGRLQITSMNSGESFAAYGDSSGLLAGLGVNTFFSGSDAESLGIKEALRQDVGFINAGKVNNDGTVSAGDNFMAKAMCDLATRPVSISTTWEHVSMTLGAYYGATVGVVGSETRAAMINADYNGTLANDLDERCAAISGVNLDEEMTNLIKFQHSYTAAAKLITTADQMLQTLLSLKQ